MIQSLDIGRDDIARGAVLGLYCLDVVETFIVGDEIGTRIGIWMLHLNLIQGGAFMLPRNVTLGIEQDAVTGAHDGHLRQIVGIIVAQHLFAQRLASVTEHVNLRQVTAQTPVTDVIGRYLIDTTFLYRYLDPLAAGELTRLGIVTLVKCLHSNSATGQDQNGHGHTDEIS